MGILDFAGGGTDYAPQAVNLDPETNAMINKSGQDALRSKEDLTQDAMKGTGDTNFLSGAKGAGNVAMSGALAAKYEKLSRDNMGSLGFEQSLQAEQTKAQRLQQSGQMAMARQQIANQNYARMIQAYNNQVAARAQVLSSLMGLAGMGAGFALGGGPVGALAGAKVGESVAPKPQQQTP